MSSVPSLTGFVLALQIVFASDDEFNGAKPMIPPFRKGSVDVRKLLLETRTRKRVLASSKSTEYPSDVRGNKGPPEVMEWRPHDPTLKQPKRRPETARTHLHALEELREIRIPLLIVSALVFLLGLAAISRYCCSGEPKRRRAKRMQKEWTRTDRGHKFDSHVAVDDIEWRVQYSQSSTFVYMPAITPNDETEMISTSTGKHELLLHEAVAADDTLIPPPPSYIGIAEAPTED